MMAYNKDIVVGAWAGNTGAGGAGHPMSAFGINTGETTLAAFINGLPADWNHWYKQPSDLVSKGGELYLSGTQNTPSCQQSAPAPAPSHGGGGGGGGKPKDHGGGD
jgi:hypothetical protein